ncbi:hypothetical protein SAMN05444411_101683 [Lutibacter oricola]|uniref:Por secretion system C-terminal sorting domain-containing protein n=1 Tax=Lutibacter oricola TaxID=762486 RepID=A0A1H2TFY3_9FLAO|nr:hypothetical protein [Lutibacter oricola]SDW42164.1 hypothetical protein SAMN05444411_101683 [Lutibacter oricola]
MKALIKKVVLMAVMVTGLVGKANESDFNVKATELNSKLIQFTLNNYDGAIEVQVKDMLNVILHSENFQGTYYSKKFDLNTLPLGTYRFEVTGETKVKYLTFEVTEESVEFKSDINTVIYKPVTLTKDKNVTITKLALNNEPLKIEVYDDKSELLHTETLKGGIDLKRILSFVEVPNGDYKIYLTTNGKTFIENIKI